MRTYRFVLILTALFIVLSMSVTAQVVRVMDDNGRPLEMVTFGSEDGKTFGTSDRNGQIDLSAFKNAQAIVVRMLGFETDTLQYSSVKDGEQITLVGAGLSLDQVVISATRWNQSKRDVPARISTLSAKEVRLQNPQTAADMIGATGEVYIQKSQMGG
ncbi:MAG: TonB-dependent receptor, partial [Flavobacteriales bacterium]